jgi:EEF1A lysine methyltransferase 4
MRAMDFPDGVFGVVLDKATLDSVLCAEGSLTLASKCLSEISRVLSPEGTFVCVSHGQPANRMEILERPEYGWTVTVATVPKPMWKLMKEPSASGDSDDNRVYHYIYICKKRAK